MKKIPITALLLPLLIVPGIACGPTQTAPTTLDTRPLEENKALEIVGALLKEKGFTTSFGATVEMSNGKQFACDYRVTGHNIAVEYVTEKDAYEMGAIPPAASGSRLHVIPAMAVANPAQANGGAELPKETIYLFILNAQKYQYHYNPTSDVRADVTYREVENRLRRDVKDFLSWHESSMANQN